MRSMLVRPKTCVDAFKLLHQRLKIPHTMLKSGRLKRLDVLDDRDQVERIV